MNMSRIIEDVKNTVNQLLSAAELKTGSILVVGCSSSEILGNKIGTASSEDTGREVFKAIYDIVRPRGNTVMRGFPSFRGFTPADRLRRRRTVCLKSPPLPSI